jgi:hypothetical protein
MQEGLQSPIKVYETKRSPRTVGSHPEARRTRCIHWTMRFVRVCARNVDGVALPERGESEAENWLAITCRTSACAKTSWPSSSQAITAIVSSPHFQQRCESPAMRRSGSSSDGSSANQWATARHRGRKARTRTAHRGPIARQGPSLAPCRGKAHPDRASLPQSLVSSSSSDRCLCGWSEGASVARGGASEILVPADERDRLAGR